MRSAEFRLILWVGTMVFVLARCTLAADDSGLIAHWTFDGPDAAATGSGGGVSAVTNHGAVTGQPGICGTSWLFSAAGDDWGDAGKQVQLRDTNQATFVAVIRARTLAVPDSKNRANSRNGIFGSDDSNVIFGLTDRGLPLFVWDAGHDKYQTIVAEREWAVPRGRWCHVAVTRAGPRMTLYVNGVMCRREDGLSTAPFAPLSRCCIGRVNGSAGRDFDGWIDDLRIYRRALEPGRIHALAAACGLADKPLDRPLGMLGLERVRFNNPGLVVDLGVGLWAQPLPMDYDGDGDLDLVVSCADTPYNGTYVFTNPGGGTMPVFQPGVRIGRALRNVQISYVDGRPRVLEPGVEYVDLPHQGLSAAKTLPLPRDIHSARVRANQWKYVDFDGDGRLDLLIGVGDWTNYGWDNAFDARGRWTRGPLHGYVYLVRNAGTNALPKYAAPVKLTTVDGKTIDLFGMPSPNMADFDADGDLDLMCGEFVDKFTYFENTGTRTRPAFRGGRFLQLDGRPLRVDLCMHVDVAIDWDRDGDMDLVVGQEDGRVMLIEHTGEVVDGMPRFTAPKFFRQQAADLKFGALVTPVSVDWDDDGDQDLVCGNTAGYIGVIENLDGGNPPRWAAPRRLEAGGKVLRIMAGPNGSIQGPCESKWGYTTLSVADWDHDGLRDLVVNSIWGKIVWYRNIGKPSQPRLAAAQPIEVQWPGKPPKPAWNWWNPTGRQLASQWRTTPLVIDWDHDGLNDLVMLDHEGYLAWFARRRRHGRLQLMPGQRLFVTPDDEPLRLNAKSAGGSGRRKLCFADWDQDGRVDLLANSRNVDFLRDVGRRGERTVLDNRGPVDGRRLAGHTTSPTVVDWDRDGIPDLLVGAEDGHFYYLRNPVQR